MRRVISTDKAPKAVGTYSQGIQAGGLVFTSGQLGIDPRTGKLAQAGFDQEADRVLRNLEAVLEAGGSSLQHVVKLTVYLTDLSNFPALNDVFVKHFGKEPPARSTVQVVALPLGAGVEIAAIGVVSRQTA